MGIHTGVLLVVSVRACPRVRTRIRVQNKLESQAKTLKCSSDENTAEIIPIECGSSEFQDSGDSGGGAERHEPIHDDSDEDMPVSKACVHMSAVVCACVPGFSQYLCCVYGLSLLVYLSTCMLACMCLNKSLCVFCRDHMFAYTRVSFV